ncbi:MAG: hypothetical protein LUC90_08925 [Lachnospiraceae bacterium]|nr:hypothetical protein [Lachnospiraceae bacterium]
MKKLGDALQALVWLLFTVAVGFGSTVYYFNTIASFAATDVIGLVLWGVLILMVFVLALLLHQLTDRKPGFFRLGDGAALVLEMICCVILVAGGIYLRIGQEFVAFWSEQGENPVVEAAYVTALGLTESWSDLFSMAYVYLLNQLFMLVGNINLAAAGMQLVLFSIFCFLAYFLVRRLWGAFCACVCLGGLMLLPEMIRVSMYCSPEILLILAAVILGWVLHLCFDRFMRNGSKAALDLIVLICFAAGCRYYQSAQGLTVPEFVFQESALAVSAQTALLTGLLGLIFFLFANGKAQRASAVYMLMAVIILAAQMLGMQSDAGCQTALSVVMVLIFGLTLQGVLAGRASEEEDGMEPEEAYEAESGPEDVYVSGADGTYEAEPERLNGMMDQESGSAAPERTGIFIPKSMEIPVRKKKAKIDYDREFPEEELKFDIEIPEEDEFDR